MNRMSLCLGWCGMVLGLTCVSSFPWRLEAAAEPLQRPHVVVIVADDLRADLLSVYGGPVKTPHMERLAARGSLFLRATCGYPICHVSRTELLTGRCVVAEAAAGKAVPFAPEWAVWPDVMRRAGWHTVHLGKWHVAGAPQQRGYTETAALFSSGGAKGQPLTLTASATQRPVTGYVGWTFKTNDDTPVPDLGIGLTPQTDVRIADAAIAVLREHRGPPLFLHVNFTAPHDPLHWPPGREQRFRPADVVLPTNFRPEHPFDHGNQHGRDELIVPPPRAAIDVQRERAVYDAVVEHLDDQVGRIVRALEEQGELDRTLVVFTSDQGLALGSHGLMGKQNQYEHTVTVPLMFAGPGIPAGQRFAAQSALRDVFPTICALTGLAIPDSVQGQSLLPILRGTASEVHEAVFGYFTDTQRMIRTPDGWKLIWYPRQQRTQLFHVRTDPEELHDLSGEPAQRERRQQLRQTLQAWLRARGDRPDETAP